MRVYESKDGSLYSRSGVISPPPPPPPPPPPSPSSPDLLTNSFEPQIRATILTIISAVHTTNQAISTYRNLCTSNVHKITAIKHLSLTADAVAIASLRKKYAQLITAEMEMCREVEGMKQGVVMLRLDLAELHELNGSVEERRNDDVEGEGWMPNIGLSRRRREEGVDGSQGDGSADAWVCALDDDEEEYDRGSEDERYDGESDETRDEDEEEDDDAAPTEDPITELDGRYLNWIQDWQTSENRKMLITLLGADLPTPPASSFSQQLSPYDEHRASYNRWEQAFGRDFEHNTSITEHENLSIKMKWQYEQPEQKKSINIDNIYHWVGKWF